MLLDTLGVFDRAVSVCDCSGPAAVLMMAVCCELTTLTVLRALGLMPHLSVKAFLHPDLLNLSEDTHTYGYTHTHTQMTNNSYYVELKVCNRASLDGYCRGVTFLASAAWSGFLKQAFFFFFINQIYK